MNKRSIYKRDLKPTNLLLQLDGRKKWEENNLLYTPGYRVVNGKVVKPLERTHQNETGFSPDLKAAEKMRGSDDESQDLAKMFAWLPSTFCALCEGTMTQKSSCAGVWGLMEDHPEIGAKRGHHIAYFQCEACTSAAIWGKKSIIIPNDGWNRFNATKHMKIEEHIITFLKMARMTDKPQYFKEPQ